MAIEMANLGATESRAIPLGGCLINAMDEKLLTVELKKNDTVVHQGSRLLERLRNLIALSDPADADPCAEMDSHGIRDMPMYNVNPAKAMFSKN